MRTSLGSWLVVAAVALAAGALAPLRGAAEDPSPARIAALVGQLGDDAFVRREAASKELAAIGEPALAALRETQNSGDAEVRFRAERAAELIEARVTARELKALQGTWSLASYDANGVRVKGEDEGHRFIVEGKNWSIRIGGDLFQGGTVVRIDAGGKVKAIGLLITEGSNVGATAASIYAVEGDSLKYLNYGGPRPAEFDTKPGDGRHFLTFSRVKPR